MLCLEALLDLYVVQPTLSLYGFNWLHSRVHFFVLVYMYLLARLRGDLK